MKCIFGAVPPSRTTDSDGSPEVCVKPSRLHYSGWSPNMTHGLVTLI